MACVKPDTFLREAPAPFHHSDSACECQGKARHLSVYCSKMNVHTGLPTQPAVKLPAFAHPVTAVAFSPAVCDSRSAAEGSGRDLLAVGLDSGALQLWGLRKDVTASGSAHTGNAITVHCSGMACILAGEAVQKPQDHTTVCCPMQRLLRFCRRRAFMGGAHSYGALRSHQEVVLDLL